MFLLKYLHFARNNLIHKTAKVYPLSIITNTKMGAFSYVSYSCKINNTTIGKFCSIAQNVKMGLGKHPINFISTSPLLYSKTNPLNYSLTQKQSFEEHIPTVIGNDVWIGANVLVLDGVNISDGAIIGANSVVTKDVAPYTIVGGVPAKEIKKRFDSEIIEELLKLKWWDYPIDKLKEESILELFSREIELLDLEELKRKLGSN